MLRIVSPSMYHKVTLNNKHFRSYMIDLCIDDYQLPVFPPFFHDSEFPVFLTLPGSEKFNNAGYLEDLCSLLGSLQNRIIDIDMHVDVIDRLKHCFNMSMLETIKITGERKFNDNDEDSVDDEQYCTSITSDTLRTIYSMIMKSKNLRKLEIADIKLTDEDAEPFDDMSEPRNEKESKLPNLEEVEFRNFACKDEILARVLDEGSKSIKKLG